MKRDDIVVLTEEDIKRMSDAARAANPTAPAFAHDAFTEMVAPAAATPHLFVPIDPRKAMVLVDVVFDFDQWEEDFTGDDREAYLSAKEFKAAAAVETRVIDGHEAVVLYIEQLAVKKVREWLGADTGPQKVTNGGSDGGGVTVLSICIDTADEVRALRAHFREEGRSYDVPYCEITGLMLFPLGFNGPRYGVEASNAEHDLDEWLEAFPTAEAPRVVDGGAQ